MLLLVENLVRDYRLPRQRLLGSAPIFRALHGVSLSLDAGQSLGVVGESGCGKSTLARTVLALEKPSAGRVLFEEQDLFRLPKAQLRQRRRHLQMVFQDPFGSLDPRYRVAKIVAEPLAALMPDVNRAERRERVHQALHEVGLKPADADKYPHQFSGGQRQRIAIARALITRPRLIVADEPVSALDVSVQAQVLNLMLDLQQQHGIAYLFISHDLSVVRYLARDVVIMQAGRIVERGATEQVFRQPQHAYTQTLIAAIPKKIPAPSPGAL